MFEKQAIGEFKKETVGGEYRVEITCPYCKQFLFSIHEPEMPVTIIGKVTCQHWIWKGKKPIKICGKTSKLYFRKNGGFT